MATPYEEIYERAVFRFRDYDFLKLNEANIGEVLKHFLNSTISDFEEICKENLTDRDDDMGIFQEDLSDIVKEILAAGIAYYWLSSKVMDQELLRNALSTKDYTYFSPANLLREAQTFRSELRQEYQDRITLYTYRNGDIASLSVSNPGG